MSTFSNTVQLIGHLGQDVEIRTTQSGQTMGRVSLATNERFQNAEGEQIEKTLWHKLVVWGDVASKMESTLSKGSYVGVSGKLQHRDYETKEGQKKYVSEIIVSKFMPFLEKQREQIQN